MRYGVLGALTVVDDQGPRKLSGPARRRLLAALLARAPHPVSADTLIEDLWADHPPATADKTLQSHVVRLRDDLGRDDDGSPLLTERAGYRLDIDPSSLDSWCFERDLRGGLALLSDGDPQAAESLLAQAASWWRGDAYAEFPEAAFAVHERIRLAELRLQCAEALTDAALALGRGGDLVADLDLRTRQHPYRERSWEQLVTALYRDGRQADALAAYRRVRDQLADDLGVDPGPALRDVERRVLAHDPSLRPSSALHGSVRSIAPLDGAGGSIANPTSLAPRRVPEPDQTAEGLHVASQPAVCPYPGLASFTEDDADAFVGRERLTAEIAGRLADNDFVVLTGPSGAGKTSLLRAGIIPALRGGALPGSAAWRIRVINGGSEGLRRVPRNTDLLAVDQAEELFTRLDLGARTEVTHLLTDLLTSGTRLLLVLRGDFYGRLADLDVLTTRVGSATVLVGPLTEDETRRAVVDPAARQGVVVTAPLVDEVLTDMRGRDGALPLLSAALRQAWELRTGDVLTELDYHAAGGVAGALQQLADRAYADLDPDAQAAARRLLLRAVSLDAGTWVRRPVPLAQARPPGDLAAVRALDALTGARIVTVTDHAVELTHEALITAWPLLADWLDERATVAAQLEHLADAAARWDADGRPHTDLLRGARLQGGLDWLEGHPDELSPVEQEYLRLSQSQLDAELTAERRRRRRLTATAVGLAASLLVVATLGGAVSREKASADTAAAAASAAALKADVGRLSALSYTAPDIQTSLLLASAAYRLQDTPESRGALLNANQRSAGALTRVQVPNRILYVGTSPDGTRLFTMDNTRTLRTYAAATLTEVASVQLTGDMTGGVSPDGHLLLMCDQVSGGPGPAHVDDAATGRSLHTLHPAAVELGTTRCGGFTGDGAHLALLEATHPHPTAQTLPDTLAVYSTGDWTRPSVTVHETSPIVGLGVGADTVALQLADGTLQIRDAATLAVLHSGRRPELAGACQDGSACALVEAPDGRHLEISEPGQPQEPLIVAATDLSGHGVSGQGMSSMQMVCAFSRDSVHLACGGSDSSLLVLNTADASTVTSQAGDGSPMIGMAWAGVGSKAHLYTGGLDRELVSWNLQTLPPDLHRLAAVPADDGDASSARTTLVGTRGNGTRLYALDMTTGRSRDWPVVMTAGETGQWLLPSPDGGRAVFTTASRDGTAHVRVYDLRTGAVLYDHTGGRWVDRDHALTASFGTDADHIVQQTGAASFDEIDLRSGGARRSITVTVPGVSDPYLVPEGSDPGGRLVMVAGSLSSGGSTELVLVDPGTGRTQARASLSSFPSSLSFSPDGRSLAVGTFQGELATYDTARLGTPTRSVVAEPGYTLTTTWSPDGSTIATTGTNGTLTLWDAATLTSLGTPARLADDAWVFAWYLPDGTLAGLLPGSGGQGGEWFTLPGTPTAWAADACAQAGRSLSRTEWSVYVPDQAYRSVCTSG